MVQRKFYQVLKDAEAMGVDKRTLRKLNKGRLSNKEFNRILRNKYTQMIKNRYISTLLNLTNKQIVDGIKEINTTFKKEVKFKDRLICLIISK